LILRLFSAVSTQSTVGVAIFVTLFISIVLRFDFKVIPRHILYRHVFSICSSQRKQLHIFKDCSKLIEGIVVGRTLNPKQNIHKPACLNSDTDAAARILSKS
jgi:hypothetical protein